ncbi:hypothetical protein BH18ACT6_BH18ACT6_05090 [soil metagenome]
MKMGAADSVLCSGGNRIAFSSVPDGWRKASGSKAQTAQNSWMPTAVLAPDRL